MHPRSTPYSRSRAAFMLLAVALAVGPAVLTARPIQAATTFVVTTTGDQPDADLADDRCAASPGPGAPCTLRAAIQEANATPGPDTIAFNIPGPTDQVKTIRPATDLPDVLQRTTIDGYTQPGSKPNTAATGTNAVLRIELDGSAGRAPNGLRIGGANSLVRGLVINRFSDDGITVVGADSTGVRIEGCFVGTDAAGAADLGNGSFGIYVDYGAAAQVGGPHPAARNLISGNGATGVLVDAPGTRVLGNLIGTTRTGGGDLGNGSHGVNSLAADAMIGGDAAGQANVIAFNDGVGARVSQNNGTRVLRNSIFANGGLGIDLQPLGPTPNDPLDADDGPNTLQNSPVIAEATRTRVTGTLHSTPNQTFALRLFSNPGMGNEGKFFEDGPLLVTTDDEGNTAFAFTPDPPIPPNRTVTATATNEGGSTSEFSLAVPVTAG